MPTSWPNAPSRRTLRATANRSTTRTSSPKRSPDRAPMDDLAGPVALDPEESVSTGDITHTLSLKDGDAFVVADPQGDIVGGVDGLFHDDTRILSRLRLLVGDKLPSRLSFGLSRDNAVFTFHGANLALPPVGGRAT